ncbi:MAG: hypothetical protein M3447_07460 [Acidobacteriota bacterium]|nr:hypothetical protein [Acidobacteriota bacterium]
MITSDEERGESKECDLVMFCVASWKIVMTALRKSTHDSAETKRNPSLPFLTCCDPGITH